VWLIQRNQVLLPDFDLDVSAVSELAVSEVLLLEAPEDPPLRELPSLLDALRARPLETHDPEPAALPLPRERQHLPGAELIHELRVDQPLDLLACQDPPLLYCAQAQHLHLCR